MSYEGVASSGFIYYSAGDADLHRFGVLLGDVSGILGATLVEKIRNVPVASSGQFKIGNVFVYDGGQVLTSGLPGGTPHTILSATHTDTSTAVPVSRGALLHGSGAGPLWAALPLGLNGQVPQSNGTDIIYDYLGANTPFKDGTLAAPSVTFLNDLDTGWSRPGANRMAASLSGVEILRLDAPNGSISLLAGQIVKNRLISADANIMNDDFIVLCSGALTATLVATPSGGQTHTIKDAAGLASPLAPITIQGNGKNIDGQSFIRITNNYGSYTLMYNESLARWNVL